VDVPPLRHPLAVPARPRQPVTLHHRDTLEPLRQDRSARQSRQAAAQHGRVLTDPDHGRVGFSA
jgi:hypothetical protein